MTSGCRCAEKDLCQTALMRSKTVIQFRAAVSWRRRIIKLRFADANRGIMGQLCKSLPIWKWTEKAVLSKCSSKLYFSRFFTPRKHSYPERRKKPKTAPAACGPTGRPSAGAGEHAAPFPQSNPRHSDDGRTCVYYLRAVYNPLNPTYINHNPPLIQNMDVMRSFPFLKEQTFASALRRGRVMTDERCKYTHAQCAETTTAQRADICSLRATIRKLKRRGVTT